MEIELQQQDYEVKQTRIIPYWVKRLYSIVENYADIYTTVVLCLIGFILIPILLGDNGMLYWGALVSGQDKMDFFRCVTSIFLHAGLIHIFVNLLSLITIAKQLRFVWSRIQIFILFFLSAWGANILGYYTYTLLHIKIVGVGASGGIFGLLGAQFGAILTSHLSAQQKNFYFRQIVPIMILNILLGLFTPNIALLIHIFGFLLGFVLSWISEKIFYNSAHNHPYRWLFIWMICLIYIMICFIQASTNYIHITSNLS